MDYRLFHVLNGLAGRWHLLDSAVRFYAQRGLFIFPVVLVVLWVVPGHDPHPLRTALVGAAVASIVALAVNQPINHLVNRSRPYAFHSVHLLLPRSADRSFPSDHSAVAFAVTAALWPVRRRLAIALAGLGALLAISRVIGGVHYPGDVAGGAAIGIASALVVSTVAPRPLEGLTRVGERLYDILTQRLHRVR
jgi:undecaprenyl-diphosphatase